MKYLNEVSKKPSILILHFKTNLCAYNKPEATTNHHLTKFITPSIKTDNNATLIPS